MPESLSHTAVSVSVSVSAAGDFRWFSHQNAFPWAQVQIWWDCSFVEKDRVVPSEMHFLGLRRSYSGTAVLWRRTAQWARMPIL